MKQETLDVLAEYGDIPEVLQSRIMSETDLPTLKEMFKSAVMAGSMAKFEEYLESIWYNENEETEKTKNSRQINHKTL